MLISETYRAQQQKLHSVGNYGTASAHYAPLVSEIVNRLEVQHLLDYGCGSKKTLFHTMKADHKFKYQAYDPAVDELSAPPVPAEMVACIDVLEHIEPDLIDNVLDDLQRVTEVVGFFSISTGPAKKILDDGRNAHLIQQPAFWWLPRIWQRFDIQTFQVTGEHSFYVVVYARPQIIEA